MPFRSRVAWRAWQFHIRRSDLVGQTHAVAQVGDSVEVAGSELLEELGRGTGGAEGAVGSGAAEPVGSGAGDRWDRWWDRPPVWQGRPGEAPAKWSEM
jgi:hypothetical protein